jgi:hypothetical protein
MLFKKQDNATKLIDLQKADQKRFKTLQGKLEAAKPEWMLLQEEAERLCALNDMFNATYRGFVESDQSVIRLSRTYEKFFHERGEELARRIEEICRKRDELTYDLTAEIEHLKRTMFNRVMIISGAFGSFCSAVTSATLNGGSRLQCSGELRQEILAARGQAESMDDLRKMLDFIISWVERIEEMDLQNIPLFRLDSSIEQAFAYEPPAIRPVAGSGASEGFFENNRV